ncbi:cell division cycle 20-like protein 1, cofactor of APC complex [Pancytospora epiphaga]|nr:cell division cycle 20-like protein 1, cofactor of APC complex [Pancytospora epiphaga]
MVTQANLEYRMKDPIGFIYPYKTWITPQRIGPETVRTPMRTLQCSAISDDFYSSLIDWSRDIIYYALENSVHAYNFHSTASSVMLRLPGIVITSVRYSSQNNTLCVGTGDGSLIILDPVTHKTEKYTCHSSRIGVLELFGRNIITGSRDRKAKIFDLRSRITAGMFTPHFQEVCGLALSSTETHLASGGNDNRAFVYDLRASLLPLSKLGGHRAAIKALSWSPSSTLKLLTGAGTADKTMRMWDISSEAKVIHSRTFDSQICNIRWLRNNSVLATFGYSNDDIKLLADFRIVRRFVGHKNRVIHFAIDDEQQYFATGSSDSSIRIWNMDPSEEAVDIKIR